MKVPMRLLTLVALTAGYATAANPTTLANVTTPTPATTPPNVSDLVTPNKTQATNTMPPTSLSTTVKCTFRYVLPTASNIASEIAKNNGSSSSSSNAHGSESGLQSGQGSSVADNNHTSHKTNGTTPVPTKTFPGNSSSGTGTGTGTATVKPGTGLNTTTITSVPTRTSKKTEPASTSNSTTKTSTRVLIEYTDLDGQPDSGKTGAPTTTTTTTTPTATTSMPPTATEAPTGTTNKGNKSLVFGEFACDESFYRAWLIIGLKCGDTNLDVAQAVAQTQCLIYSGTKSDQLFTDLKTCFSMCKVPGCDGTTWNYSATNGIDSSIYKGLDLMKLLRSAGATEAVNGAPASDQFSNLTMQTAQQCMYGGDSSFDACQCPSQLGDDSTLNTSKNNKIPKDYTVPEDKGLGDFNHWPDGQKKSTLDQAGITAISFGGAAAGVSVAVGGAVSVAGGFGGALGGTAGGLSATAGSALVVATLDTCNLGVMIGQLNLNARPRVLEYVVKKLSLSTFSFLPFGKKKEGTQQEQKRRLAEGSRPQKEGMERYADLIGVPVDQLFYVTFAGVACVFLGIFVLYALLMLLCWFFVQDFREFARRWFDKVVGVCVMVAIVSQYAIGATATFAICYSIKMNRTDLCLFLAIFTLLFFAFGTILFGVVVIKRNEDELRDLGTKDHFDKRIHVRYGTLYDEYKFESRFFFAPKLLLALLCGCTAGMIWIQGQTQLIVLIGLHILFLFFLEVKQPYPSAFLHRTASLVIVIKISVLVLSFFLVSSVTGFFKNIPQDLRNAVSLVIIGLQALVLLCLCVRQMYIYYQIWKLKRDNSNKTQEEEYNRRCSSYENFFAIRGTLNHYGNRQPSVPMLAESPRRGRAPRPRRNTCELEL